MTNPPKVTIIGSYRRHLVDILKSRRVFLRGGLEVLRPRTHEVENDTSGTWVRLKGDPADHALMRQTQLDAIRSCDLVYVVNPGGYIGSAAMFECGYANALHIPIYYQERPFEDSAVTGKIGAPLTVLSHLSDGKITPADCSLVEDFVKGVALQSGRKGADLSLQGSGQTPVLTHVKAGPLALRDDSIIRLRPTTSAEGALVRMQIISLAHRHSVKVQEEGS